MLLFIVALLIAGGVIAYVGDRLGTYIGKKRLSAWGLRPRHTAMLYTVLSGGLIAVLTLFALIGYDRTIQRALLYGPQLLAENRRLASQDRAQRLLIHTREGQVLVANAHAQLAAARGQQAALEEEKADKELQTAMAGISKAQSALRRSQLTLSHRQNQLQTARQQLIALNAGLGQTRSRLRQARAGLLIAQAAVRSAHHKVQTAQVQYNQALHTVASLTRQGSILLAHNTALTDQNVQLNAKNQQLLDQNTYLQGAHIIYHKGEEVGRQVIPTNLPLSEVQRRLVAFLNHLSQQAADSGATTGKNGRAVRVVTRTPESSTTSISENEALDALSENIVADAGNASGVVVIASARYNSFAGEQTPIVLQPYDNILIYKKNAFIADTVIDGSLPEDQILAALQSFLTSRIQPDARSRGIIPRPDPVTGEPTVGERTNSSQTLALVKEIQKIGPQTLVTARAAADTYSSGPLKLKLTAAPAPSLPTSQASPAGGG